MLFLTIKSATDRPIEVIEQLRKSGSKILGVVRNNIKKKDGSYYKKYYKNRYQ